MSRWKTTSTAQRQPKRSNSSDQFDDLGPSNQGKQEDSDDMHLAFLDDMLGGTSSNAGYTSANQYSSGTRTVNHKGSGGRGSVHVDNGRVSNDPSDLNDIDDILNLLVSSERDRFSSSSALEDAPFYKSGGSAASRSRHDSSSNSRKHRDFSPNSRSDSRNLAHSRSGKNSRGELAEDQIPSYVDGADGMILETTSLNHLALHPATFEQAPLFGGIVNAERDDDTISQITSSVTSQSIYDSTVEGSRGSYPWLRSKGSRTSRSLPRPTSYSLGETSFTDTLDEIADMIGPAKRATSGGAIQPFAAPRQNRQIPSLDDPLFRSPPTKQSQEVPGHTIRADAYRSKGEEAYLNSTSSMRRISSRRRSMMQWTKILEPFLSQFRLLLRYISAKVFPTTWHQKDRKAKEEQENAEEQEDYFGELMGEQGGKAKASQSRQRHQWYENGLKYLGFFGAMTVVLLILRLAMMHALTSRVNRRPTKLFKYNMRENVDGGMTNRQGDRKIRGGMAHHSTEEVIAVVHDANRGKLSRFSSNGHVEALELPNNFGFLADVTDLPVKKGIDIPFFWHIPRTGGGTVHDIFGECLSLTLASDAGGGGSAGQANELQIIGDSKIKYVNVDTSTPQGIERAKELDLAGSEKVDIIISTQFYHASTLFSPRNKGRMFSIFRHPVERAVSLFHFVQDTKWRRRKSFQKELSDLTIEEYFKSGLAENNWMTRFLTNELTKGELTVEDVNLAKEIVRQKCLVGLLKEKGESFSRFERYFGYPPKGDRVKECHEKKLQWYWPLKHRHEVVEEGTALWDLILSNNQWDMELYEYAEFIFQEQARIFQ